MLREIKHDNQLQHSFDVRYSIYPSSQDNDLPSILGLPKTISTFQNNLKFNRYTEPHASENHVIDT